MLSSATRAALIRSQAAPSRRCSSVSQSRTAAAIDLVAMLARGLPSPVQNSRQRSSNDAFAWPVRASASMRSPSGRSVFSLPPSRASPARPNAGQSMAATAAASSSAAGDSSSKPQARQMSAATPP